MKTFATVAAFVLTSGLTPMANAHYEERYEVYEPEARSTYSYAPESTKKTKIMLSESASIRNPNIGQPLSEPKFGIDILFTDEESSFAWGWLARAYGSLKYDVAGTRFGHISEISTGQGSGLNVFLQHRIFAGVAFGDENASSVEFGHGLFIGSELGFGDMGLRAQVGIQRSVEKNGRGDGDSNDANEFSKGINITKGGFLANRWSHSKWAERIAPTVEVALTF